MDDYNPKRRRSPQWVREMTSNSLHGLALRLLRDDRTAGLTDNQEWLWAGVISELEYRQRNPFEGERSCSCCLCIAPYEG